MGTNELDIASTRKKVELPKGYELEVAGNNLLLKRPNGFLIAAFGEGAKLGSIQRITEADERYLEAVERQERFGSAADSRTVLLIIASPSSASWGGSSRRKPTRSREPPDPASQTVSHTTCISPQKEAEIDVVPV